MAALSNGMGVKVTSGLDIERLWEFIENRLQRLPTGFRECSGDKECVCAAEILRLDETDALQD